MSEGPRAGAPGAFLGGAAPRRRAPEQLNRTGWGKRIALLLALVFGVIYAIPNLYPPDYALQLSPREEAERPLSEAFAAAQAALAEAGLGSFGAILEDRAALQIGRAHV